MSVRIYRLAFAAALALLGPASVRAQLAPTQIDAGHSYSTIWMGRQTEVTPMVNVGVAQVGGSISLDAGKPGSSALQVTLVPGGEGADLLAADGTLRSDVIARIMRYSAMTFRSTQARVRHDGRLELTGELSVVHVTREQIRDAWNATNNTTGYTDPEIARSSRAVTFVLATPRAEFLTSFLKKNSVLLLTATIESDAFPELSGVVLDSTWPTVAQDESCAPAPSSGGPRDYAGFVCTGKAISITPALQPYQSSPRDYSGPRKYDAPTKGPVTILLYLKLPSSAPAPPSR